MMGEKNRETDVEIHYKDTFRAFSKDDDGEIIVIVKGGPANFSFRDFKP